MLAGDLVSGTDAERHEDSSRNGSSGFGGMLIVPLNRQSAVYGREGIDLDVSTLADWVGAAAATLMPLVEAIRAHVFAAERIHADDTTVPVLAKIRPGPADYGPMCAMTGLLPAQGRRQRCSSMRAIVAASIPNGIWPALPD
jgi:hypothetical protein